MAIRIGNMKVGNIWKSQADIFKLFVGHLHRYARMEIQDAYKLLYQGVLGLEHVVANIEEFEQALAKEYRQENPNSQEPLWESIHPEGEWVRVHLRPLKSRSEDASLLATLCIWSMELKHGNKDDLKDGWGTLLKLCQSGRIRSFPTEEIETFHDFLKKNDFPAVHHTATFRELYRPAYRIMRRDFLSLLPPKQESEK